MLKFICSNVFDCDNIICYRFLQKNPSSYWKYSHRCKPIKNNIIMADCLTPILMDKYGTDYYFELYPDLVISIPIITVRNVI